VTDNYGNVKGSLNLAGVADPVDATFKNAPEAGKTVYGHIEDYTTKSGNTRQKFKRDQKQDFQSGGEYGGARGRERQFKADPEKQASIEAQFSIKTAIEFKGTDASMDDIERTATLFFHMIDKVKHSGSQGAVVSPASMSTPTNEPENPQAAAAHEPPRNWDRLGKDEAPAEDFDLNNLFPPED
jgi:hypothetical protein